MVDRRGRVRNGGDGDEKEREQQQEERTTTGGSEAGEGWRLRPKGGDNTPPTVETTASSNGIDDA